MRKHPAVGKFHLPSPILYFDKHGSLAPCVKMWTSFFRFFFESGYWDYRPRRAQEYYSYVGQAGGNYSRGNQGKGEIGASNLHGGET